MVSKKLKKPQRTGNKAQIDKSIVFFKVMVASLSVLVILAIVLGIVLVLTIEKKKPKQERKTEATTEQIELNDSDSSGLIYFEGEDDKLQDFVSEGKSMTQLNRFNVLIKDFIYELNAGHYDFAYEFYYATPLLNEFGLNYTVFTFEDEWVEIRHTVGGTKMIGEVSDYEDMGDYYLLKVSISPDSMFGNVLDYTYTIYYDEQWKRWLFLDFDVREIDKFKYRFDSIGDGQVPGALGIYFSDPAEKETK